MYISIEEAVQILEISEKYLFTKIIKIKIKVLKKNKNHVDCCNYKENNSV